MNAPLNQTGTMPSAFPVRRDEEQIDPASTLIGTLLEEAIDVGTFGVFQPDIVPDWQEEQSPIASTIGKVAGGLVGFVPSITGSGLAARGVIGSFGIAGKALRAAKTIESAGAVAGEAGSAVRSARAFTGIGSSMGHSMVTFAIDKATREFVDQVKTDSPDLFELGQKAAAGAVEGVTMGGWGRAFSAARPYQQALALGGAMAVSEAINDATDGVDVLSSDYMTHRVPVSFLQGVLIGTWNSRGWKERRAALQEEPLTIYKRMLNNVAGRETPDQIVYDKTVSETMSEAIGVPFKQLPLDVQRASIKLDAMREKQSRSRGKQLGLVHEVKNALGWDDATYRAFLKDSTGKESSKDMTQKEFRQVFEDMSGYIDTMRPKTPIKSVGQVLSDKVAPQNRVLWTIGAMDHVGPLVYANQLREIEREQLGKVSTALRLKYEEGVKEANKILAKTEIKDQSGNIVSGVKPFGGTSGEISRDLWRRVTTGDTEGLTPKLREVYDDIKWLSGVMFDRLNQTRKVLGEKPLPRDKYYAYHSVDRKAMEQAGRSVEIPSEQMLAERPTSRTFNANRVESPEMRRNVEAGYIYKEDIWDSLNSMVNYDLKAIYLHEPMKLVKAQLSRLKSMGNKGVDPNTGQPYLPDSFEKFFYSYVNHTLLRQPTTLTKGFDRRVKGVLSSGAVQKVEGFARGAAEYEPIKTALDTSPGKWLTEQVDNFWQELGESPARALSNMWGNTVSYAYISNRPKLALRNMTQFLYAHGFTSTGSLAKAVAGVGADDALFRDTLDKSLYYKSSVGLPEESLSVGGGSAVHEASYAMYRGSNKTSVEVAMLSAYHQGLDYIRNPKYAKLGWSDEVGRELRKSNPNALSEQERSYLQSHVDWVGLHTNFGYDMANLGAWWSSTAAKPFLKLVSYPFQYAYQYCGELRRVMMYGDAPLSKRFTQPSAPGWAGSDGPKLPASARLGLAKHVIGLGVMIAAMEKAGLDFRSIVALSYSPDKAERGEGLMGVSGLQLGVFDFRPSPGVSMLTDLATYVTAEDDGEREYARKRLASSLPIPGRLAAKDVAGVIDSGELSPYLMYTVKEPKRKKIRLKKVESVKPASPFGPSPLDNGAFD